MWRCLPAALVLAVTAPALAIQTEKTTVVCPIDQTEVEAVRVLSTNNSGGFDRDLCPHARDGSPLLVQVATCPTCGYSAPTAVFERAPTKKTVEQVKRKWGKTERSLPPHERWARHAQILGWQGAPAYEIAEAWVAAAWSTRLAYNGQLSDPALVRIQSRILTQAMREVSSREKKPAPGYETEIAIARTVLAKVEAGEIDKKEIPMAVLSAAAVLRSRGEDGEALSALETLGRLPRGPLSDAAAELRASIELEHAYFDKAMPTLRGIAADSKISEKERARASYLAAEIARRTGRKDEARALYLQAQTAKAEEDEQLKRWIERGLQEL